ncbi:hypothetical protein D9M68_915930 [compost metagenome]
MAAAFPACFVELGPGHAGAFENLPVEIDPLNLRIRAVLVQGQQAIAFDDRVACVRPEVHGGAHRSAVGVVEHELHGRKVEADETVAPVDLGRRVAVAARDVPVLARDQFPAIEGDHAFAPF